MIEDNKGQVSLEYLLIFAISLILLIVFTLPLTQQAVENTLDISDTLDIKSDLSKVSQAIKQVYGEGQGSKQTISIMSKHELKINIEDKYISCSLMLNDGSSKHVKIDCDSNLEKSSINLQKGENLIVVEWPAGSKNMRIYTKLF